VSQRRSLLELAPELQPHCAAASSHYATRVPWPGSRYGNRSHAGRRHSPSRTRRNEAGDDSLPENRPVPPSRIVAQALREFDHNPERLADALHGYLGSAGVHSSWRC